ncbi:MAG: transcriptional repressor [Planctomycetaceae bacterium]|nr:transcriptional repressor [Planctomycetales bacterium]MCB9926927.1 transcriptional repressor [Planctomycetaceae bacterium]
MSDEYSLGSVEVSLSPLQRFEEYIQSRGKRMTPQKKQLLEHVFSRHEHFDADTLIDNLPDDAKGIGRATVYRALSEFVDAGLLREFQLDGRAVYEHDYGYPQHDHLYCKDCQKLIEFQSDELLELRESVARKANFRVTNHRLIITGVCEDCRLSKRRRRQRLDMI